jgi:tetratricopeptide (TPR) repeat protein
MRATKLKNTNYTTENPLLIAVILLSVLAITFLAFQDVSKLDFTNWDDPAYVLENQLIRGTSPEYVNKMFTTFVSGNYHPLTMYSLALDYARGGLNPAVYHQTNLILHLLNTLLVFIIMLRLFHQKLIPVAFIALAFALHPLKVESVAWIAERKDVLYGFFWLASWLSYIHYRQSGKVIYLILTHLLFIFSCLSKAMAVTLVPVLFLTDYIMARNLTWRWLKEKFFLFLIAIGTGILAIYAQDEASALGVPTEQNRLDFTLVAFHGILFYLQKTFIPLQLSTFYPYPFKVDGWLPWQFTLAPLGVIALAYLMYRVWLKTDNRWIAGGLLLYLVSVFPVLQWLPVGNAFAADRYFYLPSIGVFMAIAAGMLAMREWNKIAGTTLLVVSVLWLVWCFTLTRKQVLVWKNSITLFSQVAKLYPNTPEPYNNMGIAYGKLGDQRNAINNYLRVLELNSKYGLTYNNLGNAYGMLGQYDSAYYYLQKAMEIKPTANIWSNMGNALGMLGKSEESRNAYLKAIEMDPTFHEPYHNLGASYAMQGDYLTAIPWFEKAIAQLPDYADAWFSLGITYEYLEQKEKAMDCYQKALTYGSPKAQERILNLKGS